MRTKPVILLVCGLFLVQASLLQDKEHLRRLEVEHWRRVAAEFAHKDIEHGKLNWGCCRECANVKYYPPLDALFPAEGSEGSPLPMAEPPSDTSPRPSNVVGGPAKVIGGKQLHSIRVSEERERLEARKNAKFHLAKTPSSFMEFAAIHDASSFGCCNICPDFQSFVKGFRGRPFNHIFTPFYRFKQSESEYPWHGRNPSATDGEMYNPILPPCCSFCETDYASDILVSGRLPRYAPGEENVPGVNELPPVLLETESRIKGDDTSVKDTPPNPKANTEKPRARVAESCCKMCVRKHVDDTSVKVYGRKYPRKYSVLQ